MEQVGKTFVFDYGEMVIRVRYLSDKKLAWEQITGPARGPRAKRNTAPRRSGPPGVKG